MLTLYLTKIDIDKLLLQLGGPSPSRNEKSKIMKSRLTCL